MTMGQVFATYPWKGNTGIDHVRFCPCCGEAMHREAIDHMIRPRCPGCGFIFFRNPAPTVTVLVLQGGQVLMGRRSGEPGKGKWGLPSGYLEFNEDFLSAAVREVKEETGLEVELQSILNVESAFLPPEYHFLTVYLLARVLGGELSATDDLESVTWFPLSGPFPEIAFPPDADLLTLMSKNEVKGLPLHPVSSS